MGKSAEEEIRERQNRMAKVSPDALSWVWLRELTDEITRLRHDLKNRRPGPDEPNK